MARLIWTTQNAGNYDARPLFLIATINLITLPNRLQRRNWDAALIWPRDLAQSSAHIVGRRNVSNVSNDSFYAGCKTCDCTDESSECQLTKLVQYSTDSVYHLYTIGATMVNCLSRNMQKEGSQQKKGTSREYPTIWSLIMNTTREILIDIDIQTHHKFFPSKHAPHIRKIEIFSVVNEFCHYSFLKRPYFLRA